MDWTYPSTGAGDRFGGIGTIAERLIQDTSDRHLMGTRFTYDFREMLRATREIEASVATGGDLWVGFQNAGKMDLEASRYARITSAGTKVVAFGTGDPNLPGTVGLRWVTLEPSTDRLENQWFLVTTNPEPIAFVSWEVSDPAMFGKGGISNPEKQFVGFVTDEPRVIESLINHLGGVAGPEAAR
ncbi:MAG: DICT sensory domain-containing protein [Candidatus Limnocylindrales bacterium]